MPSATDWHHKLRDLLDSRIDRRDVWLNLRVDAKPEFPFEDFDDDDFVAWAEDWIDFSVTSTAGPVMPSTAREEWVAGDGDVHVTLMLAKRSGREGPLVGNPDADSHTWLGDR